MSYAEARQVLYLAQSRGGSHPRLSEALACLGIVPEKFRSLMSAARQVEKGRKPFEICTPSGCGVRV